MSEKIINLSGRATDVLYALFFRGALQSGDLPSKSGAAQLRDLGLAETRHTATPYQGENYYTFLTAEGQKFAIKHLVNTRFGEPVAKEYYPAFWIKPDSAQKAIDAIREEIRNSKEFEDLINGTPIHRQVQVTDTMIGDAVVSANYILKMNVNHGGKLHVAGMAICVEDDQRKVVFEADNFKAHEAAQSTSNNEERALNGGLDFGGFPGTISHVHDGRSNATKTILTDEMREAIISAVRESDLFTSLQTAIAAQEASTSDLKQALNDAVGDAIRNAIRPGGALWAAISHR
ncbi:DUF1983 domain-containing protein [Enterobacter soli]|uniref:DUF1983 domain-containing protein n=1 Tax=Enterobacter soli TaxID=885040 RepID=UPI0021477875|nr:DUF1983 domain-containing protein [Enterobacter soli]MCR1319968.1 DUF1983 domain-containing protein [Enterobacter soli]